MRCIVPQKCLSFSSALKEAETTDARANICPAASVWRQERDGTSLSTPKAMDS